jgi:hypothetical protein
MSTAIAELTRQWRESVSALTDAAITARLAELQANHQRGLRYRLELQALRRESHGRRLA